ncbi:hypothetical protein G6O67_007699 [Ophiocordyceps sinensis]|uniref:Uncharacterized protein n=1 Tax=Ophiocordyceps sinensis TaxID=72228 RepID=A0A8H4LV62_9HYPO|nr:hypothetical protein G6O67_007699 [Ophiocordyceps sinensis]
MRFAIVFSGFLAGLVAAFPVEDVVGAADAMDARDTLTGLTEGLSLKKRRCWTNNSHCSHNDQCCSDSCRNVYSNVWQKLVESV